MTDAQRDELQRLFVRHGVVLAYLFGSQAEGRATLLSDVDIAVWFSPAVAPKDRSQARLDLTTECCRILECDAVDVVVLNNAPPLLQYDVARHGRLIYEDPATRPAVDFFVYAFNRYLDTRPFRRLQNEYLAARLRERRSTYAAQS
ncbi:MAG: nucleotidyltransferase domain-containing protein [Anaerolineales bacterium]|nr:nucleotidyltransferase domain-containing protein [Anaerolineales bacterium]